MSNMTNEQKEQDFKLDSEFYLDSNLFIYSAIDRGFIGGQCKKILKLISEGKFKAYTSTLTIDEILWRVQKETDRNLAGETAKKLLAMQNLEFINIDMGIIFQAIDYYTNDKLDPRDSIHLAAMRSRKINTILSSDPDFDKIKGIKRIDFTKEKIIREDEKNKK